MTDAKYPQLVQTLNSFAIESVAAETVTFYTSAGAADAGEVAGAIVYAKLAKAPVLNKLGERIGEYNPASAFATSVSFTTGVMDSTKEVGFVAMGPLAQRMTDTAAVLSAQPNGSWALDYSTGLLIVKKASAATFQIIASYKVAAGSTSSGSGASYDAPSDSDKVMVLNPAWTNQGVVAAEDIAATSSAFTRYYDVEGLGEIGIEIRYTSGTGTVTVKASRENNGTADSSADYVDITQYGCDWETGAAAASMTAAGGYAMKLKAKTWKYLAIDVASPSNWVGSIFIQSQY